MLYTETISREMARVTGLEPATLGVTGRYSNQLSYTRAFARQRLLGDAPLRQTGGAVNTTFRAFLMPG